MKNYLVTMTFCVGELEQYFTAVFSGKTEKAMFKQVEEYYKNYYGEGSLEEYDEDCLSFLYNNGAMVKLRGYEKLTSLEQVITKLRKD